MNECMNMTTTVCVSWHMQLGTRRSVFNPIYTMIFS